MSEHDCEHAGELAARAAAGAPLAPDEAALLRQHRASCADCRLDERLRAAAGDLDAPGPAPALDDLGTERLLRAVLQAAAAPAPAPAPVTWRSWRRVVVAGGLLAAAAAVLLVVRLGRPALDPARVLLAAGAPTSDGGALAPGAALRSRQILETRDGRVGLSFCGSAAAVLDHGTRARLLRHDRGRCELELIEGLVVVSLDRLPAGRRVVVIAGGVESEARGTVFAVEARGAVIETRVQRGRVAVRPRGDTEQTLEAHEAWRDGRRRAIDAAVARRDAELALAPQAAGTPTGTLTVTSAPPGALVRIDERLVGPAPVTLLLAGGDHALELALAGHAPARDVVRLDANTVARRHLVLLPRTPPAASAPATAPGALPAPPRVPPAARAPTADELLAAARQRRAAGDVAGAVARYREIGARFPRSGAARAALVPLGELLLERTGEPAAALAAFERYLGGGTGPLAEEAAWGRVRALRRLGRTAAERAGLRELVARHPGSLNAAAARRRLAELDATR